jgi:hypothetical protein
MDNFTFFYLHDDNVKTLRNNFEINSKCDFILKLLTISTVMSEIHELRRREDSQREVHSNNRLPATDFRI